MKDKPSFPPRMEGWEYQYERAEKLEQQNAALVEALKPFALQAEGLAKDIPDDNAVKIWVSAQVLREALALVEGDKDG